MSGLFITGTGTEVGKTAVSLALCIWGNRQGLKVAYYKPVQCGSYFISKDICAGDPEWIKELASFPVDTFCTCEYENPVSPHLAAEIEDKPLNMEEVMADYIDISNKYDLVLVEGAGGSAVPIDRKGTTMADIIVRMKIPCLLACLPGLGTLNHSITSHFYLEKKGVLPAGFIMCHTGPDIPDMFTDNVKTIRGMTRMPYWGQIKYSLRLQSAKALSESEAGELIAGFSQEADKWRAGLSRGGPE